MGWDLSLRAQSCRALSMTSIWLREDGEGKSGGQWKEKRVMWNRLWDEGNVERGGINIDLVLGFNLKGSLPSFDQSWKNVWMDQSQTAMEHDLEDGVIIGEEGKKRNKEAMEELSSKEGYKALTKRTKRVVAAEGTRGGLCLAWKVDANIMLRTFSKRHIDVVVDGNEARGILAPGLRGKEVKVQHLVHSFSNHCPLLINTKMVEDRPMSNSFKFEAWWILEDTFFEEVKRLWESSSGTLLQKLENLKKGLSHWAGKIQVSRRRIRQILTDKLAELLDNDRDEENMAEMIEIEKDERYWTRENYDYVLSGIDRCVFEGDNLKLTAAYTSEEIREVVFEMGAMKAPSEDGFPALFYLKCCLCNVLYKILANAIANLFRGVIGKCIDKAQSAFVPGRLISDNVLLAYEIFNTLKQKRNGKKGFTAVKLDMSKTYDRVEWSFIKEIMIRMGFATKWVEGIMKCMTSVSYSIVMNGFIVEKFQPTRGLRQGDPFSPFLFLLCGEGLSSLMRLAMQKGRLKRVKASRSGPAISHLLFADDCILLREATIRGASLFKTILSEYRYCSGQHVNFEKSTVFFSRNTSEVDKQLVVKLLAVRCSNELERYLGLPNMVGRRKKESFQNLKDQLKKHIDNWSTRYLSQGGKEVFIKAILQAIPTYTMTYFLLPRTLCDGLERIIAKFWWQKGRGKRGIHWCTWKNLCCLKENGGLGFQNLGQFNIALLAKQGWRLINYPNSLLAKVLKARYYPQSNFLEARLGNLPSFTWNSIWASKGLLQGGLCWRVGNGKEISIWNDCWIPGIDTINRQSRTDNDELELVSDLIDCSSMKWKTELIHNAFQDKIAQKILRIPLAETSHEDSQVWKGEQSGRILAQKILSHRAEQDGAKAKQKLPDMARIHRCKEILLKVKMHFDAAFNKRNSKSVSGVVVWGLRDEFLPRRRSFTTMFHLRSRQKHM
ncbi:reverse transcriptase [Gossypium australe]|uniref:Reverse transcriptase n=1 Tax=Gossypium australe TaxID=47621 RepID=A0A5B6WT52_9ROSI|nr:reverse transcriptase [Gossypium australe]